MEVSSRGRVSITAHHFGPKRVSGGISSVVVEAVRRAEHVEPLHRQPRTEQRKPSEESSEENREDAQSPSCQPSVVDAAEEVPAFPKAPPVAPAEASKAYRRVAETEAESAPPVGEALDKRS